MDGKYNTQIKYGLKDKYKDFILIDNTYKYFLTLTFATKTTFINSVNFLSQTLYQINRKVFGRRYLNYKENYVDGFVFYENFRNVNTTNKFHTHMLIKNNNKYDKFSIDQMKKLLIEATSKVINKNNKSVFNKDCIDIRDIYDQTNLVEYCSKNINDFNLDSIKLICKSGISDSI